MKRLFDPCGRRRQTICLFVAGVLPQAERSVVERHLAACPSCRSYFAEVKSVTTALTVAAQSTSEIQPSVTAVARWENAIRQAKIAGTPRQTSFTGGDLSWWQEVLWPWRGVWTGLAGAWAILLAFHLTQSDASPKMTNPSVPAMASFREQHKILNELLADRAAAPDLERPKSFTPKPRTERAEAISA